MPWPSLAPPSLALQNGFSVHPPRLGPFIGHTSDTTATVWLAAKILSDDKAGTHAYVGIVTFRPLDGSPSPSPQYVSLHARDNHIGRVVFSRLRPDTEYGVECAIFVVPHARQAHVASLRDGDIDHLLPDLLSEDGRSCIARIVKETVTHTGRAVTRTRPHRASPNGAGFSFFLGSCHYPDVPTQDGAEIFEKLLGKVRQEGGRTLMIHCGDQIYGDTTGPLLAAHSLEDFQRKYEQR